MHDRNRSQRQAVGAVHEIDRIRNHDQPDNDRNTKEPSTCPARHEEWYGRNDSPTAQQRELQQG